MIENRQDGEPFNLDALKALNPDASMKKGGILKTAGPKVCTHSRVQNSVENLGT